MNDLILPKIYFEKGSRRYDLHWDYQSSEAENVLFEHNDFLRGYIGGCFDAFADRKAEIVCLSSTTGTIRNLSLEHAEKFKTLLEQLLHPLVKKRYKKLVNEAKLRKFIPS